MTLMLVDGPNLLMRAMHAPHVKEMSTLSGISTGALVVFVNTLTKHIREEQPTHIVVAWEGQNATAERKAHLPDYKAHRAAYEDQGAKDVSFDLAELFLTCCGIPSISRFGCEADDVIGAFWAHTTRFHTDKIVIVSNDKDMLQLVGTNPCTVRVEQVRVSSHGVPTDRWGSERVWDHYGVPPSALGALLAIWGDEVDGIKGVPGLGPKKGAKLLADHDLDLRAAFGPDSRYAEHRERVLINYDVINLRDLDLYEVPPPPFTPPREGRPGWDELMDFCDRYELAQIKDRLLTGLLWRPGQDGPPKSRRRLSPAKTTT